MLFWLLVMRLKLNWIAEKILRRPLPIARAELICIAISNSWWDRLIKRDRWLMWTIWDSNPELTKELYEKID